MIIPSISIKNFYRIIDIVGMVLAVGIGIIMNKYFNLKIIDIDFKEYVILIALLFFIFHLISELFLLMILSRKNVKTQIYVIGNPLLKIVIIKFSLLVLISFILLKGLKIGSLIDFIITTFAISFFVGAIFESYRLLRRVI